MFTYSVISATLLLLLVQDGWATSCWIYGVTMEGNTLSSLTRKAPETMTCGSGKHLCLSGEIELSNNDILSVGYCAKNLADKSLLLHDGLALDEDPNVTVSKIVSMEICSGDTCNEAKSTTDTHCYQYGVEFKDDGSLSKIVSDSNEVQSNACPGICVHGTVTITEAPTSPSTASTVSSTASTVSSTSSSSSDSSLLATDEFESHFFYNLPRDDPVSVPVDVGFCWKDDLADAIDAVTALETVDTATLRGCSESDCNINPSIFMCHTYGVKMENGVPKKIDNTVDKIEKCSEKTKSCVSGYVQVGDTYEYVGFCNTDNNFDCSKMNDIETLRAVDEGNCIDRCDEPLCNKKPQVCDQYGATVDEDHGKMEQSVVETSDTCPPLKPYCLKGVTTEILGINTHFQLCHSNPCKQLLSKFPKVSKCEDIFGKDYIP